MTVKQLALLKEIRRELIEAYRDYFERSEDGHCKPSEGYIEVRYPNYFENDDPSTVKASGIGIYSYVLGPSRMHDFATFEEALAAVRKWCAKSKACPYEEGGWA